LVISAPLLFHKAETIEIFKMLNFSIDENIVANNFLIPLVILSVLSNFLIYRGNNNDLRSILFLDSFSIIILNYFFNPILAFTIYFCFLHSIRHSLSLISEINKNLMKGFPIFLRKIIPLTVITAIMYLIVFYFISEKFGIDESIIKIIFVGLASLTFPHILLEFMVEKK
jgi:Brp/Blh family beta-carotene 15,15'-monooxygenase